jgi:Fur family ferric uptake transcriptional regulator
MPGHPPTLTRIETLCAHQGLRLTGQRRLIARILSTADDHPGVEEVFRRALVLEPGIALSTVYRTVKLFADRGMLERHEFGHAPQPRARFEASPQTHHDHLIDAETGDVIEFMSAEIEALQVRIARELGYELVGHRLELYGVRKTGPHDGPDDGRE